MDLKKKKVCEYFFWKLRIVLVELYNHYSPWKKTGEEVDPDHKIREKEWKTRDAPRLNRKLRRSSNEPKDFESEGLRGSLDPKSVEKFGGIVD